MLKIESENIADFWEENSQKIQTQVQKLNANPENVENGLVKVVLSLVELLRGVVEKQAIRKIEKNNLTEAQIEEVGLTLMRLEQKMDEFKIYFGLEDKDLQINLGNLKDL